LEWKLRDEEDKKVREDLEQRETDYRISRSRGSEGVGAQALAVQP
jgi:hypothetical protein